MFKKRTVGDEQAFGKIPAYCRYELFMERYRAAAEVAHRELGDHDPYAALDIGCGYGRLKRFFDFYKNTQWYGIECNRTRMEASASLGYRMQHCNIDKNDLPFSNQSFDLVAGLHVLEHITNPRSTLREMDRVLKAGGLLVLGVPTKPPLIAELINGWYALRHRFSPRQGRTCNAYSSTGFVSFLQKNLGEPFVMVDIRGLRLFSARKWLPLENWLWFYRFNTWIGKKCRWITPEINVVLRKGPLA